MTRPDGILFDPPEKSEPEINIFGPGVGECILVHLGNSEWLVVDSCQPPGDSTPAALSYLSSLGLSPASIRMIVATHWHDDHVKGISKVYDAATESDFFIASSIRPEEFLAVTGQGPATSRFTSGVDELSRVARVAGSRSRPVVSVAAGQRIRYAPDSAVPEVWALSPSPRETDMSRMHIASLLPTYSPGSRRIPSQPPNDTSVVLALETTLGAVLLGGDLEHLPATRDRGWHAVVDLRTATSTVASIFKVPHHGSENAHCPEVWEHNVEDDALVVITPFDRGTTSLPRPSDRDRIRDLSSRAFLTSDKRNRPLLRDRTTERTIREAVRVYAPKTLRMGHVQLRAIGGEWRVGLSDEAVPA